MIAIRSTLPLCALLMATILVGSPLASAGHSDRHATSKIARAYDAGEISFDQNAFYQVLALRQPDQLPEAYRSDKNLQPAEFTRCGTPTLLKILQEDWSLLSPSTLRPGGIPDRTEFEHGDRRMRC